jgi:hypothetical protein
VRVLAVVAPFDDAAHGRSTAGFDGLHQAMLIEGQAMSLPVSGAVLSKDVGQLQGWRRHQRWARWTRLPLAGWLGAGLSNRSSGLWVAPMVAGETAV